MLRPSVAELAPAFALLDHGEVVGDEVDGRRARGVMDRREAQRRDDRPVAKLDIACAQCEPVGAQMDVADGSGIGARHPGETADLPVVEEAGARGADRGEQGLLRRRERLAPHPEERPAEVDSALGGGGADPR